MAGQRRENRTAVVRAGRILRAAAFARWQAAGVFFGNRYRDLRLGTPGENAPDCREGGGAQLPTMDARRQIYPLRVGGPQQIDARVDSRRWSRRVSSVDGGQGTDGPLLVFARWQTRSLQPGKQRVRDRTVDTAAGRERP